MWLFLSALLAIVGALCLWGAKRSAAMKQTMDEMPTTKVGSLSHGYVEIKGTCSCDAPLKVPHVEGECVYYSYEVEEREETHEAGEHRWRTIDRGSSETSFTLTDESGSCTVDPEGATHDAPRIYEGYIDSSLALGGGLAGVLGAIAAATSDRRVTVYAIMLNTQLYILGTANKREDGTVVVGKGEQKFFISTKSEEALKKSYGRSAIGLHVATGACFLGALICLLKHFGSG